MKVKYFNSFFDERTISIELVCGGGISSAYRVKTSANDYFIKINTSASAYNMFWQEINGLEEIAQSKKINVPQVLSCKKCREFSALIMKYITPAQPNEKSQQVFARKLAQMHNYKKDKFGLGEDNYIGTLPQLNQYHNRWSAFYLQQRLMPQLNLALRSKKINSDEMPAFEKVEEFISPYLSDVFPSLLHGDLWAGNYIISDNGEPVLIDPAVYYGHSEVDLAMTELFGGFDKKFYQAYYEIKPKQKGYMVRRDIYQLYYLLVHLNLFGARYKHSVVKILRKYFL